MSTLRFKTSSGRTESEVKCREKKTHKLLARHYLDLTQKRNWSDGRRERQLRFFFFFFHENAERRNKTTGYFRFLQPPGAELRGGKKKGGRGGKEVWGGQQVTFKPPPPSPSSAGIRRRFSEDLCDPTGSSRNHVNKFIGDLHPQPHPHHPGPGGTCEGRKRPPLPLH